MVAQRGVPNLAEPVQKESFARHTILNKPNGPSVGKEGDGSRHQELTKAWKYIGSWKLQEAKLIYEETMREDSRKVSKSKTVKGPIGHAKEWEFCFLGRRKPLRCKFESDMTGVSLRKFIPVGV